MTQRNHLLSFPCLSTAKLVKQESGSCLGFHSQSRASTPPAEERVTSFFARAKKKVTKKESTLRGALGGSAHEVGKDVQMAFTCSSRKRAGLACPTWAIGCFEESVLLDGGACSGADPMDWMASRQPRLAKQLLGGAEQRAFFW